jgi:hypothetical protein
MLGFLNYNKVRATATTGKTTKAGRQQKQGG